MISANNAVYLHSNVRNSFKKSKKQLKWLLESLFDVFAKKLTVLDEIFTVLVSCENMELNKFSLRYIFTIFSCHSRLIHCIEFDFWLNWIFTSELSRFHLVCPKYSEKSIKKFKFWIHHHYNQFVRWSIVKVPKKRLNSARFNRNWAPYALKRNTFLVKVHTNLRSVIFSITLSLTLSFTLLLTLKMKCRRW